MNHTPIPTAFEVRDLFEGMLGRDVEWEAGRGVDPLNGATVAMYTSNAGALAAVAVADIPLTARAGSAIALLPPAGADSAISSGLVTPAQFDNLAEILNVAASLFNKQDVPHLRLHEAFSPRETLPRDVAELTMTPGNRLDGVLTIQGYGEGRISFVVAM